MKKLFVFFAFMLGLAVSAGCSVHSQAVQVDDKAYLLITANHFQNKTLLINDKQEINLITQAGRFDLNGKTAVKVQIPAGKHNVKIIDKGSIIVNRNFYVSTGTSFEVAL